MVVVVVDATTRVLEGGGMVILGVLVDLTVTVSSMVRA